MLVTTTRLYEQKVAGLRSRLPQLQHILLADADDHLGGGVWSLPKCMAAASHTYRMPPTDDISSITYGASLFKRWRQPSASPSLGLTPKSWTCAFCDHSTRALSWLR